MLKEGVIIRHISYASGENSEDKPVILLECHRVETWGLKHGLCCL